MKTNALGSEHLSTLMVRYCTPCTLSLLTGALYNIVDQIFISNASDLGSAGNAANTVVFPLTVVALAFAVMIGDGACASISFSLGQKDEKTAARTFGSGITLAMGTGIVLCLIGLVLPVRF